MVTMESAILDVKRLEIDSRFLERVVQVDLYIPRQSKPASGWKVLLINDGQDLERMPFTPILEAELNDGMEPIVCVGLHCGAERRMEYGTAGVPDYMSRGAKAQAHLQFVLEEVLPLVKAELGEHSFAQLNYAGFSLGGLSAIDAVWAHPELFSIAGVFSGSLWWRSRDLNDDYNEDTDRIMHQLIREGQYHAGQRFYFTTGSQDESADRNGNGIIDSIDDTLALVAELEKKGYTDTEIRYVNYEDGRHDVATWARALPAFLQWGWGKAAAAAPSFESC